MTWLVWAVLNFAVSPAVSWIQGRLLPRARPGFAQRWFIYAAVDTCVFVFAHAWHAAAVYGLSALAALIVWWWRRRKDRKRALRALGNKAKATLAALVRNMPRPSPRLVPQGVPA